MFGTSHPLPGIADEDPAGDILNGGWVLPEDEDSRWGMEAPAVVYWLPG
jgi:hypothetical protein